MKVQNIAPDYWLTFDKRTMSISDMDQQHLSNVYWMYYIFHDTEMSWVIDELNKRFNGQLLPYLPHTQFSDEIDLLTRSKALNWYPIQIGDITKTGVITWNRKIIGGITLPLKQGEAEAWVKEDSAGYHKK